MESPDAVEKIIGSCRHRKANGISDIFGYFNDFLSQKSGSEINTDSCKTDNTKFNKFKK